MPRPAPTCPDLPGDSISRRPPCLSLLGDLHTDLQMAGSQIATVLGRYFKRLTLKEVHPWKLEEGYSIFLFLFLPVITVFLMGNNQSTSQQTPLRCILGNWKLFHPLTLRRSCLKFFSATVWPQYPLGDKEHWPEDGILNYNAIVQLDLFCKRQGKWTEIPYVQIFF